MGTTKGFIYKAFRHNKKRSEDFLANLEESISQEPTMSIRKLSKEKNVGRETIRRAVKDLGLVSYRRRRRQLLTATVKASRVAKGNKLLSKLKKSAPETVRTFLGPLTSRLSFLGLC